MWIGRQCDQSPPGLQTLLPDERASRACRTASGSDLLPRFGEPGGVREILGAARGVLVA
jgi:hypothetical protein